MKNNILLFDRSRAEPILRALLVLRQLTSMTGHRTPLPLICLCAALLARPCAATPGGWDAVNNLNVGRLLHTATLLQNGKVLIAGGEDSGDPLASAELYDPASLLWSITGSLNQGRSGHTATLLQNGKVLVAGGYLPAVSASAEIYDPATGSWTPTGSLNTGRYSHTATLLPSGKVLVAGGRLSESYLATAELYDPSTGIWSAIASLGSPRAYHTATLLPGGQVLVAGGSDVTGIDLASAQLYDPSTGTWTGTGSLNTGRAVPTATLLPSGKVLIAGGWGSNTTVSLTSAELYDPATGTWTPTGSLNGGRTLHKATLMPDGQVLVSGGYNLGPLTTAELYDPAAGIWSTTGSLNQGRYNHTATLLPDGTVLAAAGTAFATKGLVSAELYGSPVELPANVQGRGAFDNQGNPVTFQFQASQSDDRYIGYLSICDEAAAVCTKRGRVTSLTISGSNADISGFVQLHGSPVTFDASVTDNGEPGTLDTISISLSNGYSAGGTLTSGDIRIY